MYKTVVNPILLKDSDGGISPFEPEALQVRIAAAFQSAGMAQESYISDDIVLALEYTLRRAPRPELIFNAGEIDAAVIRLLENSGFAKAAEVFRNTTACEQLVQLSATPENLRDFLAVHLGCSQERLEKISEKCAEALRLAKIELASLHLVLELARHYERETAEADLKNHPANTVSGTVLTRQDIVSLMPPDAADLIKCGILRINAVSPVFPGIRFFFFMEKFASFRELQAPVTELELYPALYETSAILEDARSAIAAKLASPETPPCLMTIPDMFDFIHRMIGSTKADTMAAELAGILCSGFKAELYQLSFD